MRTHPDIGLLEQVVTRCQQTCYNLRVIGSVYKFGRNRTVLRLGKIFPSRLSMNLASEFERSEYVVASSGPH